MDFRILGPLEVWDRGGPVELRRQKPRALLAFLVLHAGEHVSSDALIEALWGESPPRTARAALQNYVAQLRRALGPGIVDSSAGGYVLEAVSDQIDLGRFERLAAEGRNADGDERVEKLREALDLWRGPPLADLLFEPFAASEAARLGELKTTALEDLVDAELARGSGPDLVVELEELIAEHPFRERLRGQLILALYRSGRQADALEAYQETRRTLVDELGIEPGAALRELEQAILRQDPSLEAQAPPRTDVESTEERRRKVTILFADVACPGALDPEPVHEATARALAAVREGLERYGATIEQRTGDEVMAVFGIPRAHEDDALRAARSALELKAEIDSLADELEREGREPVELRVALEAGEVLSGIDEAGHGFAVGPAITLAKRILQQAGPGEILSGPAALDRFGGAVVVERGGTRRDGASLVLGLVEGVAPLPRRLEAPLVNRGFELDALREAFARTVEERDCRLFLIVGEAGIGKTRLAAELSAELDGDATVLVGRCVSHGRGATYLPLMEIIRQVAARRRLDELLATDEYAEVISTRLADLVGELQAPGSGGETFWAVRRLIEALADEQPVVLVFEDLHWAEPTLLDLIDYFVEQVSTAPILLLGLARPDLLAQRTDWARTESARLAPLSSEDGVALIENIAEVPDELRTRIIHTAGGNPLFIEQLLAHTAEGGEPETAPPSLEGLLASRLDMLEPGELSVLQRAAVAGREFSREAVLQLLADDDPSTVDARLLTAVQKGLLNAVRPEPDRPGRFRFHHVLIHDAAYGTVPKAQRAELHEHFARWLESRPIRSEELIGYHLEQAHGYLVELGTANGHATQLAADAGTRLSAAGLRAAKSGDVPAAKNLLTRAVALVDAAGLAHRDLLTELGLVVWRSGELPEAERLFDTAIGAAIAEGDRQAELRARTELANLMIRRAEEGAPDVLFTLASEAIPVLEQLGDDRALGRIWFALATTYGGFSCQYQRASEAAERALACFRRSDWPLNPCLMELAAGLYYGPTPVPEAIRRSRALLAEADRGGAAQVFVYIAGLEAMAGRFDAARELAAQALQIFEDLAWTVNVSISHAPMTAGIELMAGDFGKAERILRESCRTLEAWGLRGQLATQATQLAEALYAQGRHAEAVRWSEKAEECAAAYDVGAQFLWRAVRGKALALLGAVEEGEGLTREAAELAATTDSVSQCAQVLLGHAEVLRIDGRTAEAGKAIEDAIRLLDEKGNVAASRQARAVLAEMTGA